MPKIASKQVSSNEITKVFSKRQLVSNRVVLLKGHSNSDQCLSVVLFLVISLNSVVKVVILGLRFSPACAKLLH